MTPTIDRCYTSWHGISEEGQGKSGDYSFSKSKKDNITENELKYFKKAAKHLFALTDNQLSQSQAFHEIKVVI
ncbi:MAG: type II toxin-antitoxin system RelE/ParE family toxin [Candidatus Adiutrix sp.]|nr:type II toxin-antitoxin system RelE/ParE family toxin [Candidatus Adiutrix sp.]